MCTLFHPVSAVGVEAVAELIVACGLRASLPLGVAAGIALVSRSSALTDRVWRTAVVAAAVLPLAMMLPGWSLPSWCFGGRVPAWSLSYGYDSAAADTWAFDPGGADDALVSAGRGSMGPPALTWWLCLAWAFGCVATLVPALGARARLAYREHRVCRDADARLRGLADRARRALGLCRPIRVLLTDEGGAPMTWGVLRPRVCLPACARVWNDDQCLAALLHECAHVQRRDCLLQQVAVVVRAMYWFHPLSWLAAHGLRVERERRCDAAVIDAGCPADRYAEFLVGLAARGTRVGTSIGMVSHAHTQMESRIMAILSLEHRSGSARPWHGVAAAAVLATAILVAAGVRGGSTSGPAPAMAGWSTAPGVSPAATAPSAAHDDAPAANQTAVRMRHVITALQLYAADHNGQGPVSLGDTLPYMRFPETGTRRDRAAMYLSVRDERETEVPADPSPAWINANSSFTYLGQPGVPVNRVAAWDSTVLLHDDPERPYAVTAPNGGLVHVVPVTVVAGVTEFCTATELVRRIAASREALARARE